MFRINYTKITAVLKYNATEIMCNQCVKSPWNQVKMYHNLKIDQPIVVLSVANFIEGEDNAEVTYCYWREPLNLG